MVGTETKANLSLERTKDDLVAILKAIHDFMATEYVKSDEEIDNQHHKILGMYCDLAHVILSDKQSDGVVDGMVLKLVVFLKLHFSVEENLMLVIGYHGMEAHSLRHHSLVKDINVIMDDIRVDSKVLADFAVLIGNWLLDHERTCDKDFAEYMAARF